MIEEIEPKILYITAVWYKYVLNDNEDVGIAHLNMMACLDVAGH